MTRERMQALRYSNDDIERGDPAGRSAPALPQLREHGLDRRAVRRFVRDAGDLLDELNELTRCDCTTRNERKAEQLAAAHGRARGAHRRAAPSRRSCAAIRPDLDGNAVMDHLGIAPGAGGGRGAGVPARAPPRRGPARRGGGLRRLDAWWAGRGRRRELATRLPTGASRRIRARGAATRRTQHAELAARMTRAAGTWALPADCGGGSRITSTWKLARCSAVNRSLVRARPRRPVGLAQHHLAALRAWRRSGWGSENTSGEPGRRTRCDLAEHAGQVVDGAPSVPAENTRSTDALVANPRSASSAWWNSTCTSARSACRRAARRPGRRTGPRPSSWRRATRT